MRADAGIGAHHRPDGVCGIDKREHAASDDSPQNLGHREVPFGAQARSRQTGRSSRRRLALRARFAGGPCQKCGSVATRAPGARRDGRKPRQAGAAIWRRSVESRPTRYQCRYQRRWPQAVVPGPSTDTADSSNHRPGVIAVSSGAPGPIAAVAVATQAALRRPQPPRLLTMSTVACAWPIGGLLDERLCTGRRGRALSAANSRSSSDRRRKNSFMRYLPVCVRDDNWI